MAYLKVFVIAFIFCLFVSEVSAAPLKVSADRVKGNAEFRQEEGEWKVLKDGTSVPVGASVRTGVDASCMLKWPDGATVKVTALTTMKVEASETQNTELNLVKGRLAAHVKKVSGSGSTFLIKTPTAVAGVRGTDFSAGVSESGAASFAVGEGSIEVQAGGEVIIVETGLMVIVDVAGQVSPPEPIPPTVMQEIQGEFKEVNEASEEKVPVESGQARPEDEKTETVENPEEPQTIEPGEVEIIDPEEVVENVSNQIEQIDAIDHVETAAEAAQQEYIMGTVDVNVNLNGTP